MPTNSLAQSLVDAAAEAIDEAVRAKWHGDQLDFLSSPDDWRSEARAATLAVLGAVAASVERLVEPGLPLAMLDTYLLRDLADQIRESPCL